LGLGRSGSEKRFKQLEKSKISSTSRFIKMLAPVTAEKFNRQVFENRSGMDPSQAEKVKQ